MDNTTVNNASERTTVYLDPRVKRGVQYYALRDDSSLSKIINEKLIEYLEDESDRIAALDSLDDTTEPMSFSQAVKELGFDIHDIRDKAQAELRKAA
ncbi:hypothetical protein JNM87_04765 [Candidatus Saccharibacteria bacterium]|nr:hypothetical protein [Candidatus Saccharibacteria bacterium]